MALHKSLGGCQRCGKKTARPRVADAKLQRGTVGTKPRWVEGEPSYLDGIRAFQATLTEEEKDALHLSLQPHVLDR